MTLTVTNTMSRRKEEFVPRDPGKASIYVCGPTVYNHIHIGNARPAIVFDVIRRYLTWSGYEVKFVQNYTDVDDKIIAKAHQEGRSAEEVAGDYSAAYEQVMQALGVAPPDLLVKATDHIADMVASISTLIKNGVAYESQGNVWFSVADFPSYGKLSRRSLDDIGGGERIEPDSSKRGPVDFALWKAAKPGEPSWESPWGKGRPGWHIECSTMSTKYLGMGFDIHGGGSDLIFPHHENEIAQAEAESGEDPFVRYWLHNGMVNLDHEKMSKSLGNFVLVKDFFKEASPQVLRMMAISGHYRSDVDFGEHSIMQARRALERFETFSRDRGKAAAGEDTKEASACLERFRAAMDDDFNTPLAISVVHDVVKHGNIERFAAEGGDSDAARRLGAYLAVFDQMTAVLGFAPSGAPDDTEADSTLAARVIELTIELRQAARKAGRYDDADLVRTRLGELGIELEDTPSGTRWRQK